MISEAITKEQIEIPMLFDKPFVASGGSNTATAIGAVTMGFSTDPVARWVYPDPADYIRWFPSFVRAFAGKAFENGTAICTNDGGGAALWLPPNVHPDDDEIVALTLDSVSEEVQRDLFPLFEAMGSAHPDEPHWYLPMIGVETHRQGNGIGAALMHYGLERVDASNLPAYLESSNPRNISLYRRFGFEVVGTIQIGSAPPLYPMLRPAVRS